jgi:hypothetical protein
MKYLLNYKKYQESVVFNLQYQQVEDLMESLNIWYDALLSSIDAKEVNIFDTLKLPIYDYSNKLDLDYLENQIEFINALTSLGLKKSPIEDSSDFETFLNKPCKFMFIYDIKSNELENPIYLFLQVWNSTTEKWDNAKLYEINDNIRKFYDKMTSRTIEIIDSDDNYIYQTSNGNEWNLLNTEKENDVYVKTFRKDELQSLLKIRGGVKVSVI